jgi:preprotein translocase subunit YajC
MEQMGSIIMLVVMFALMYFVAIRPANKQRREQEVMIQNLEKGDSILTTSGFYGVVIDIMEEVVIVEFGNNKNCRIPMKKDCIAEVEKAK